MNIDNLLSKVLVRILNDKGVTGEADLKDILGELKGSKGAKKPDTATNPYFTVHNTPANIQADTTAENGTIIINCFVDNYPNGMAKTDVIGQVGERLKALFHDKPLQIDGITNYNLVVRSVSGALFDPGDSDEHYCSVRLKYNIIGR